jgi:transcriptional regulator with XRE-family HTH domain
MSPDEVKAVRARLGCTAKDLARVLEVEPAVITAWERGELFPTKRHVELLRALDAKGPGAVPRTLPRRGKPLDPMALLADPATWALFRKVLAHAELREAVTKLAASYADPAEP